MSFDISEKEWRASAKQLDYVKHYAPEYIGKNYDWEVYQQILIASLKESTKVQIFARPFKSLYELEEKYETIDDIVQEFESDDRSNNRLVISRIRDIAEETERYGEKASLKFNLTEDQVEDFIHLFKDVSRWNGEIISKIESESDGFYYKTFPHTINAGNVYYVDDDFSDKIDRINQQLKDDWPKIVEREVRG